MADVIGLIKADWNYKHDGSEEDIQKLMASVAEQGSVGTLCVRHISIDGRAMLEVFDGNHRLEVIKRMGIDKVPVEDFGDITQAQAIIYSRQRNEQWFKDNEYKFGKLLREVVVPQFDFSKLTAMLPTTEMALKSLADVSEINFEDYRPKEKPIDNKMVLKIDGETLEAWNQWKQKANEFEGEVISDEQALLLALKTAMSKL